MRGWRSTPPSVQCLPIFRFDYERNRRWATAPIWHQKYEKTQSRSTGAISLIHICHHYKERRRFPSKLYAILTKIMAWVCMIHTSA